MSLQPQYDFKLQLQNRTDWKLIVCTTRNLHMQSVKKIGHRTK